MEFLLQPLFPATDWLPWSAGSHETHREQSQSSIVMYPEEATGKIHYTVVI